MSVRLDTVRNRIRTMLRDTNAGQYAIPTYAVDDALSRNLIALSAKLGHPMQWDTSFATLVDGTSEYTVDKDYDFHTIALFKLSDGSLLEKVSAETMARLQEGASNSGGAPVAVSLLEAKGSVGNYRTMTVTVWPTPGEADTLYALTSDMPVRLSADADGIPLSELGQVALEYATAGELLLSMSDAEVARIGMSRAVVPVWQARAAEAEDDEFLRVARFRRARGLNMSSAG